jgi:hypothetical protein
LTGGDSSSVTKAKTVAAIKILARSDRSIAATIGRIGEWARHDLSLWYPGWTVLVVVG